MNRVQIRLPGFDSYAIKYLRRKGIDIYNIDYNESSNIYTIPLSELENIDVASLEIVSYRGIKNLLLKIKIHKYFILSVFLSIILMFIISMFVVEVEVIHSDKDIRALLEEELYDRGVRPFTPKKTYSELQKIKEDIKSAYKNDIEWLEIIDDGMRYTVRVEERIITKEEQKPPFCHVVSTKDSIVLSSSPKKGQVVVAPNDFVRTGDILISGAIKFNDETKSYVCAEGEVYGNTWYRVNLSIPLVHTEKVYTSNKKSNIGFEIGSTYNRIFKIHFDNYDVSKKRLFGFGKFAIYKEKVTEYEELEKVYDKEEAVKEAIAAGKKNLEIKLSDKATILSEKVLQTNEYDSIMNVEIFYSVKEIIGNQIEAEMEKIEENEKEE